MRRAHAAAFAAGIAGVAIAGGWWATREVDAPRISPPRPISVADAPLDLSQPTSVMDVPVRVDVRRLLTLVEGYVPIQWVEESVPVEDGGPTAAMAFTRGPFSASFDGEMASLSATLAYALRTSYEIPLLPDIGLSCGVGDDEAPRMDIGLESPLSLTSDWRLRARTQVAYVRPTSTEERDRCDVSVFDVDVTDRVAEGIRAFLSEHTSAIDSIVATVDVQTRFEEWWTVLSSPIQLDSNVWLHLDPEAISRGQVTGHGSAIELSGRLTARPRIHFGAPPPVEVGPLPTLGTSADGRRFGATLDALSDYRHVSDALTTIFRGSEVEAFGRRITIDRLAVSGLGANRVAVEVAIAGDVSGTLYFVGTPVFDRSDGLVSLPDLAMTVTTSDLLVAGASWVLDSGIESMLRQRARWPVDQGIEWATAQVRRGLNATLDRGLRLSGEIDDLEVLEVVARKRGLLVRARASGRVELLVEGA